MNRIEPHILEKLIEAEDVSRLSLADLRRLVLQEDGIKHALPDGRFQIDPRNGDIVLFVSRRGKRPSDTKPLPTPDPEAARSCPICLGKTTGIIDAAPLSQGTTFINKNLYPVFYPFNAPDQDAGNGHVRVKQPAAAQALRGLHFLQWTSSLHDLDWHNMPLADRVVVMNRLAALEKTLLQPGQEGDQRYVVITKNYGRLVGSSLVHGHQQIALSSVMPRRYADNLRFADWQGERFSSFMLRENPAELLVRDYGPVVLLVPYFMRRPYDMMLIVKDVRRQHLYQLAPDEITAVAAAWGDAIQAIMVLMPEIGREIAYTVTSNNGPGAGLYFEFLPYTQELGGFEHLGLITSQGDPAEVAGELRERINNQ